MDVIFDIETFKNCFTFCAVNADRSEGKLFEISSRKNELHKMLAYLRQLAKNKDRMVGFNNLGFDYPVLHWIMKKAQEAKEKNSLSSLVISAGEIYAYAQDLIERSYTDRFGSIVPTRERFIEQVDLFKIHHYDNRARATSLKMIEFNMRSNTIEDLPYYHGDNLTSEQMDKLIRYNKHDVMRTLDFYDASMEKIEFRKVLSEKLGMDCTNFNDTKVGKEYFVKKLEEANPGCCYKQVGRQRKLNQTKRDIIHIKDVIFPYIKFERPEFQAILDWFKVQSITETKGVFTDLPEWRLGDVAKYAVMREKREKLKNKPTDKEREKLLKEKPLSWIEEVELKSGKISYYHVWRIADNLNIVVDGLRIDYGTGGLHASVEKEIIVETDELMIRDGDVTSLYPSLSIKNRVYPEHLGEQFCDVYEQVFIERTSHAKGTPENACMKLALNGVYGASNDEYSPMYDPMFTMAITIGGQLCISMWAERLTQIEGLKIISINTDGITSMFPRDKEEEYNRVCKEWENLTKLTLEFVDYERMCCADVNSYIAVYKGGEKVKRKGRYEYKDLDWNKNMSGLVIKMAAEHELLGRGTVEDFILNHKDNFDFMLRTKAPRTSRIVLVDDEGNETPEQNICRYYVANNGKSMVKIMPPASDEKKITKVFLDNKKGVDVEYVADTKAKLDRALTKNLPLVREIAEDPQERRIGIQTGWLVKTCNNMKDFDGDINFNYYISESKKLVEFNDEETD